MKFNREYLEELTLQKIKKVNDEAGYRSSLEVPEMVELIASVLEERMQTICDVRDVQSQQIANLTAHINKIENEDKHFSDFKTAEKKIIEFHKIINDTLRELPVGNISTHTPESIPERVSYYLKELAEYTQRVEDLENKKLDPKQPICTKCVNNLTYYDGWHCQCEEKDFDRNCWVNFGHNDVESKTTI